MNPTLIIALKAIAYLLIALLASPLIEGVMRKIKALIHSRKGPPVWQPYLDLAKLLVKEDLSSESGFVSRFAPPAAFASALSAAFLVPLGVGAPAAAAGDLFLFVYLITLSSACIMAGAFAQSSPFSHVGGAREMMMVLTVEAVLVISLLIVAVSGRTAALTGLVGVPFRLSFLLGIFCYFFAMQAMLGKLPFDIPEAEQEIMEGPFIEYSGPSLALFRWTFHIKQLVFASLFLNLFIGLPRVAGWGAPGAVVNFVVNFAGVMVVAVLVVLVDATNPRLRIDQSMRFFAGLIGVSLVGVGLAAFGL
jgi:formate hydrogenlyase subunit 4